jgi:hypothetical protein
LFYVLEQVRKKNATVPTFGDCVFLLYIGGSNSASSSVCCSRVVMFTSSPPLPAFDNEASGDSGIVHVGDGGFSTGFSGSSTTSGWRRGRSGEVVEVLPFFGGGKDLMF